MASDLRHKRPSLLPFPSLPPVLTPEPEVQSRPMLVRSQSVPAHDTQAQARAIVIDIQQHFSRENSTTNPPADPFFPSQTRMENLLLAFRRAWHAFREPGYDA